MEFIIGNIAIKTSRKSEKSSSLAEDIKMTRRLIDGCISRFNNQSDNDRIEACIYELEALKAHYRYLLRQARNKKEAN